MACILKPKCNFLHGYFRCLLPLETEGVGVKVKTIKGSTCLGDIEPPRLYHAIPGAQGSVPILP